MKDLTIEEKAKAYDNLIERLKDFQFEYRFSAFSDTIERYFPELREPEDERIRRVIRGWIYTRPASFFDGISKEKMLAWIEKQDGKINPYSGTSFKYNNHTWGMCARDGGVDILCDNKLIKHIDEQKTDERKEFVLVPFGTDIKSENDTIIIPDGYVATIVGNKIYIKKEGKGALEAIKEEKIDKANKVEPKFKVGDIVQYITDSTDRRKIEEVNTLCNMYHTDSSPIMFEIEDEWKVVVNAEDVEQKPTDKIESKFKDGDWIVYKDAVWKVCNIALQNYYELLKTNNEVGIRLIKDVDENAHLWTIADAKDGDVLYHKSKSGIEYIVMNKGLNEHDNINSYFRYNSLDGFGVDIPAVLSTRLGGITPATKEQRDILFKKMKENGYEWDSEKKELIKINLN